MRWVAIQGTVMLLMSAATFFRISLPPPLLCRLFAAVVSSLMVMSRSTGSSVWMGR